VDVYLWILNDADLKYFNMVPPHKHCQWQSPFVNQYLFPVQRKSTVHTLLLLNCSVAASDFQISTIFFSVSKTCWLTVVWFMIYSCILNYFSFSLSLKGHKYTLLVPMFSSHVYTSSRRTSTLLLQTSFIWPHKRGRKLSNSRCCSTVTSK
jgi:hypothetical protein